MIIIFSRLLCDPWLLSRGGDDLHLCTNAVSLKAVSRIGNVIKGNELGLRSMHLVL